MSVSALSEQLAKAGHDVWVFTTTANGENELIVKRNEPLNVDGVNVIYFKRITKDHSHFSPKLLSALYRNVKSFDVVHIHAWWNLVSVLSCILAIAKGVKVIVSPRGTLSTYSFQHKTAFLKKLFHQTIAKKLLSKCTIHSTSASEKSEINKLISAPKVFNIPNFITLPPLTVMQRNKNEEHINLLFLSRIDEKKGLDVFINALALLETPWKLSVVGEGDPEYIETLKKAARRKNIDQHINWLGFRGADKFDIYRDHDLFVLPSHNENFGNVVIESLSMGTPVLLSKNVGLADYVEEQNLGWVFNLDPVQLKNVLEAAVKDVNKRNLIQKNAPLLIREHFGTNALMAKYEAMYRQTLSGQY